MTHEKEFFYEPKQVSKIKMEIVSEYFKAWATIVLRKSKVKLLYFDLFAGKGKYEDGTESIPIRILKIAINDSKYRGLRSRLITIFNDKNSSYVQELTKSIRDIQNIDMLSFKPEIKNYEVDEEVAKYLKNHILPPTLSLIDPWGYKGVSRTLIEALIRGWGCDCVVFFNYNRINPALSNPLVTEHMYALFGESKTNDMQVELLGKSPAQREEQIIQSMLIVLEELGGKFSIPFRFRDKHEKRTSHYLIFSTKNETALKIMKEIMNSKGTKFIDGINCFEYSPVKSKQTELQFSNYINDLNKDLLVQFAGQEITIEQVFLKHHKLTRYIKQDYKVALLKMEEEGTILTNPPAHERRAGTLGDKVRIKFPEEK